MPDMTPKTPRQVAEDLDEEGRCLSCKKLDEDRQRGLCRRDYGRFRRKKESLPEEEREFFDDTLVAAGMILPSNQGGSVEDPFSEALRIYLEQATVGEKDPDRISQIAQEIVTQLGKKKAIAESNKSAGSTKKGTKKK